MHHKTLSLVTQSSLNVNDTIVISILISSADTGDLNHKNHLFYLVNVLFIIIIFALWGGFWSG